MVEVGKVGGFHEPDLADGAANLDEISFPTKGWSGLTLRLYDSDSDEWALYWVSDAASRIEPPVVGRWNDRREFVGYCDDGSWVNPER